MKTRLLVVLLCLCLLFCAGCDSNIAQDSSNNAHSSQAPTELNIDPALLGVWTGADPGEREMVESLYFYENGSIVIELSYEGSPYGTLYGSFTVDGHYIICDITEGADPYQVTYEYRIDGRMLTLTDDDGPANYLRTS